MKGVRTVLAVPAVELGTGYAGLLRPIFELTSGETVRCDPRTFPNRGLIFTPSSYDVIYDDTPTGTLVQLRIEENVASTVPPTEPNYAKYIVSKNGWGPPERWAVQMVVEHAFSRDNRTIHLNEAPRHPIWLRDSNSRRIYGPFDTTSRKLPSGNVAVDLQPPEVIPFAPDRDPYSIASMAIHAVEFEDVEGVDYLVFTRAEFAKKPVEWIDFSTDEAILEIIRDLARAVAPLTPGQVDGLRTLLASQVVADSRFKAERLARAAGLLDSVDVWHEQRHALIDEFLSSDRGSEHVDRHLEQRQDELVDKAFKKHHGLVLQRIQQHTLELADLAVKAQEQRAELDELRSYDREKLIANRKQLESELDQQRSDLNTLRVQIGAGKEALDLREEVSRLTGMLDSLRFEVNRLTSEREELQQVSARLREEAESDNSQLRSRLTAIKPYVDTLTGASIRQSAPDTVEQPRLAAKAPPSLSSLVDRMHEALSAANHHVGKRDVANVFTGIITSPLTILAGLPGVGKTSLVTRLSEALGMAKGSQFLTVRVPRGWRSRQDVLGYHNPITGEYERAPTGVYSLLNWHRDSEIEVPAWLLFDEANLSAPEHYLSDFLGMMDEAADRSIATGAPGDVFSVPQHLRFVFTINQDHSVETLTPRVLDRAAVVYVPPPESFEAANAYSDVKQHGNETLTVEQLAELLKEVPADLNPSEDAVLKKVVKVLRDPNTAYGVPTHLSPRKHRRVLKHATTLRHILGVNAGTDALDHAVAAHVLPLLRGSGKAYRARLDALAREIEGLPVSFVLLTRILAAGEAAFDEYSYQTLA